MTPVNWGIMSTAQIALNRVIPAMKKSKLCHVSGIASRDIRKASDVAERLDIPEAYGTYEELLADPKIEAIYNPLPNHLHLEWTKKAAEAGKHVLCEKPLTLNAVEAEELVKVRDRTGVHIEEAFMLRDHPQWRKVKELVQEQCIGSLRAIQGSFTFMNDDPTNIRNIAEVGGGSIYDVGCYPTTVSRMVFESEPTRVVVLAERDPHFGTDRLASVILDFPNGQASFVVSTQAARYQQMLLLGTEGWLRVEIPFVVPSDVTGRIDIGNGTAPGPLPTKSMTFESVDQTALHTERFSRLVRTGKKAGWPLEDSAANMRVIDALFRSERTGTWEPVM